MIEDKKKQKFEMRLSAEEKMALIYKNKDMLQYTNRGTIHPASIQDIFDKEKMPIGRSAAITLATRTQWKYPDLKPSP